MTLRSFDSPFRIPIVALALCLPAAVSPPTAAAQDSSTLSDDYVSAHHSFESPELFTLELRIGPYEPDVGNDSFSESFPDDDGPLLGAELDFIAFRLKKVLMLGVGMGVGFANYSGHSLSLDAWASNQVERTEEETDFDLIPLSALAVLRVDALARKLGIPFIFTGKVGYRWAFWSSEKGGVTEDEGISPGFAWAAQIALDLDFFDLRAARQMDEEWGINHSFLFFEVFGSETEDDALPVDDTIWAAGLGFVT
jgi:hypothetical protein